MPNFLRITTAPQKRMVVSRQFAPSADQNDQPLLSIHGRMRNIGRVGSTNQKVPSEWPAIFSVGWRAWCIQIMASREVSGSAMSKAESLSLKTCTLLTIKMITAVSRTFTKSCGVKAKILLQGICDMVGFSRAALSPAIINARKLTAGRFPLMLRL